MRRSSHARPTCVERLVGGAPALWRCGRRSVEARPARAGARARATTEAEAAVVAEHLLEPLLLLLLERRVLGDHERALAGRDHADVVVDLEIGQRRFRVVADDGR